MQKAQKRNALRSEKFWFRKNISPKKSSPEMNGLNNGVHNGATTDQTTDDYDDDEIVLMTIDEIINGKKDSFPGLVPLIHSYLSSMEVDTDTHCTIQQYLKLIQKRASGELLTTASWIRKEVLNHPEYK